MRVPDESTEPDREGEWRPVTEEQRARAAAAIARLKADLARAERPATPDAESARFFGPVGLDADGNLQPPLTAEEIAYFEAARRGEPPEPGGDEVQGGADPGGGGSDGVAPG